MLAPPGLVDLYDRVADLLDQIEKAEAQPVGPGTRSHLAFDCTPRVAFPLKREKVDADPIDRTTTMLSGPLFTSENFPRPTLSKRRAGEDVSTVGYCEHIAQVKIGLVSEAAGYLGQARLKRTYGGHGLHRRSHVLGRTSGRGRLAGPGKVDPRTPALLLTLLFPEVLGLQHRRARET